MAWILSKTVKKLIASGTVCMSPCPPSALATCVLCMQGGVYGVSQVNETAVNVVRKLMHTHYSASLQATNGIIEALIVPNYLPSILSSFLACLSSRHLTTQASGDHVRTHVIRLWRHRDTPSPCMHPISIAFKTFSLAQVPWMPVSI